MSNDGESLKDRAEHIRKAGLAVMGAHTFMELKEIWRRLPNATAKPPQSQRALAEAIALQLDDLGDGAPKDLKAFIAEAQPLREFGSGTVEVTVTATTKTKSNKSEGKPGDEAAGRTDDSASNATDPTNTSEDTTMQAQTHASGKKQRPKAPGSSGLKAKTGRTSGAKAKTGKAASGAAKKASGSPGRKPATGPREGTMISIVVKMTKDGKGREAIGNAIAKAFPKSTFAEEVKAEDYHAVAWYQNQARKRGWLPKLN